MRHLPLPLWCGKETIILRRGPLDGQTREVETDQNEKTDEVVKHDRVIIHHYRRIKKKDPKPDEMPEFELYFIEHIDPIIGKRLDS
jgi:hypothetical protein